MYPMYQLLVYGWYSDGWWRESDPDRLDCTQDQLNLALQHAMAPIQAEFYSNYSLPTEGGLVSSILHTFFTYLHKEIEVCVSAYALINSFIYTTVMYAQP